MVCVWWMALLKMVGGAAKAVGGAAKAGASSALQGGVSGAVKAVGTLGGGGGSGGGGGGGGGSGSNAVANAPSSQVRNNPLASEIGMQPRMGLEPPRINMEEDPLMEENRRRRLRGF